MPGVIAYFIVGGVAAIATFVATPLARKAANRFEIISAPDERDVHESPTPNLGGPAMLFGLLAGSLAAWLIGDFSAVFSSQSEILGVLLSAVVMCAVGVIDDVKPITAPAKIAGMVIAIIVTFLSVGSFSTSLIYIIIFLSVWLKCRFLPRSA